MRIMNNVSSLNAWRNLTGTDSTMSKSLERLSSGFRINRASDDVAGLAISENMRAQIRGLNQAIKNAQDGISLIQTAEGSLSEVHSILQRMRELSLQSANGVLEPEDRSQIQTEMDNLAKEITRTTNATQFNSKDLIDGSLTDGNISSVTLQIGPNPGQTVNFAIGRMDTQSLGVGRDVTTAKVFHDQAVDFDTDGTVDWTDTMDGGQFIASVDETGAVGAGLESGEYYVKFDDNNKTVQLFSDAALTKSIGTAVKIMNDDQTALLGDTVTIGSENTAQTITLNLEDFAAIDALASDRTDRIMVGSRVAALKDGGADANADSLTDQTVVDASSGTGITAVGWGLTTGDYDLEVVDTDADLTADAVQLKNSNGNIGSAVSFATITADIAAGRSTNFGDDATGRTISVDAKAVAGYTLGDIDTIKVINNGQASEDAKFDGGVKYANAQNFAGLNVSSADGAKASLDKIDAAIAKVSFQRSQLGAIQNRLDHTISNLSVVSENLTASESRIRDVDMAMEMSHFTKSQILMQSGTAMLAQANSKNQAVLSLLR